MNSLKRPYNSDQGRGAPNKRRREIEFDLDGDVLESKMVRFGETDKPIDRQMIEAAKFILREAEKDREKVIQFLTECAAELPEKTTIYSVCVGLVNCDNYDLAGDIVEGTIQALKVNLRECKWDEARNLIRFCADLANSRVITNGSLISLFENLIDVTAEDNIPQVRSDFYVYAVLSALPFVGKELAEKDDLDQLLNTVEEYISKRSKAHVAGLRVWESDSPHAQEEYLDCLWAQTCKLRNDKWIEYQICRLQHMFPQLANATQHTLPDFLPPPHEPHFVYPFPRVLFRLFDYTDCPEGSAPLPGAHSIERFLAEESIRNIMNLMFYNRKDCAKALSTCPSISRLPFDYMIVEVIFGEMLALPKSRHIEIFYGSLLIELCKMHSQTWPLVLAQAVQLMFERLDSMHGALIDKLSSWFAYLLSNFQFKWSWEDWSMCVSQDALNAKPTFIRETFIRCMRLSYQARVTEFAPNDLKSFVPKVTDPLNKFAGSSDPVICELSEQLREAFKNKNSELIPSLDRVTSIGKYEGELAKVNLFVNVLLNTASQSYTHMFTALGHWLVQLNDMIISEEAQIVVLHSLFEVWQNHPQLMVVATEKLMKYGIIDASAIVSWIFTEEMGPELMKFYSWEILHKTMLRKLAAVKQQQSNLHREREVFRKFNCDSGEVAADNADDIPTEENIERMEELVDSAQNEAKTHLQLLVSKTVSTIVSHIQMSEMKGAKINAQWLRWMLHRLQQLLYDYHDLVFQHLQSFQSLIFTPDVESSVTQVLKQLTILRE